MKKAKLLGIALVFVFAGIYSACNNPLDKFTAADTNRSVTRNIGEYSEHLVPYTADIERISQELFGNVTIGTNEFLFNLDESPDFIYVNFTNSGYAVFAAESLELLEFAAQGSLPYQNIRARRYYNGPQGYFTKTNESFVNEVTNESFAISASEAKTYSQAIRQTFSIGEREIELEPRENNGELVTRAPALSGRNAPPLEEGHLIQGTSAFNVTYISNSNYFAAKPMHGQNLGNTCGSVAAQLLLSYNNYYNDRCIIAPDYLNGGWNNVTGNNNINDPANYTNPEQNPNACINPMTMTRQTTGSNNAFYNSIIAVIEPGLNGSYPNDIKNGLISILNGRGISHSINSYYIDSADDVRNQINSNRPVVILMQASLGGSNHWVVGYGYGDFIYPGHANAGIIYSGYIVHFGWDNNGTGYAANVWINSEWCHTYITMQINHSHDYVPTGNIINGQEIMLRCTTCNHRKTDTIYNVSGNTITGLNYALTSTASISIPASINNVSINAIGYSAFENQTYISAVTIPNTVTKIGQNAFLNTGLWNNTSNNNVVYADKWAVGFKGAISNSSGELILISNTVGIGDYAFSQISGLKEAEIPNNVTRIGISAFSINSNLARVWIPSSVISIDSHVFVNCPSLTIYAQAASQPAGWHTNWNLYIYRPVLWGSSAAYVTPEGGLYGDGTGELGTPYELSTPEHLANIYLNPDKHFILMNDIDIAGYLWTPIAEFSGVLDGDGYSISGISLGYYNTYEVENSCFINNAYYYGMISKNLGTIKNLKVYGYIGVQHDYYSSLSNYDVYAGLLAGYNDGDIINCEVHNDPMISSVMVHLYTYHVNSMYEDRVSHAGGFVGLNAGLMEDCDNYGFVLIWDATIGEGNGLYGYSTGNDNNCNDYGEWWWPNSNYAPSRIQALGYFNDLRNKVRSPLLIEQSFFRSSR